ncbi:MAG: ATP-binding protein [Paludibacteraceae bacterium]|nr:ATP-binding protein [Paludibacteraceae bacterium]
MERLILAHIIEWYGSKDRKPLLICGARQVGKTWLMKEFAKKEYKKWVYINFEDNELAKNVFEKDFDIKRIIMQLSIASSTEIDSKTLLLFDELQEAPRGVTALKYFQEKAPEYSIIAAGSLLGITLHQGTSFPVGKVEFLDLAPLSFIEFLIAVGAKQLAEVLTVKDWSLIAPFHELLCQHLRTYYFVGGMPGVVSDYVANGSLTRIREIQKSILTTYDNDFSKHAPLAEVPRIRMVWKSIMAQLSKENKKYIFGLIKEGGRAKEFELAIEWLADAGLLYKVSRTKCGLMPLSAYEDFSAFKIFLVDVGLLCAMNNIPATVLLQGSSLFTDYKGALTEQYVFQQLRSSMSSVYYWSADNSSGKIDFLVQLEDKIIPIEVKAEENLQAKSLKSFVKKYPALHGIRTSMSHFREQDWMTNIPLYAIGVPGVL